MMVADAYDGACLMPRMQAVLQNLLTVVLVACALVVTSVVVRREFFPRTTASPARHVADWAALLQGRAPSLGTARAPLRMVLFSDYQCPFCKDLDAKLSILAARHPGQVSVTRYELPLTRIHAHAYEAAIAAKCAERQGVRQPFQAQLFKQDMAAVGNDWVRLASAARIADIPEFSACMRKHRTAAAVDADMAVAHRLGIDGVPALIVDGELYSGTMEMEMLERIASEAM
jgi:protein-disulfide isomerase